MRRFKRRDMVRILTGFKAGQTGWISTDNGDGTYYVTLADNRDYLYDSTELQDIHENNGD